MMLPVLSSENFVYHKYDTSDFAVVRDMLRPSIYSDDNKLLYAMV